MKIMMGQGKEWGHGDDKATMMFILEKKESLKQRFSKRERNKVHPKP
jgi:hypothetical protein